MMLGIVDGPIDVDAVRAAVSRPEAGAVLVFEGVARNSFEDRRVVRLDYEAYAEMAVPVLETIARAITDALPEVRVAIVHRTGVVEIGEASVVIAVSAPHRAECYEASRWAIEAVKERLPVWKKEIYDDGSAWKANAPTGDR